MRPTLPADGAGQVSVRIWRNGTLRVSQTYPRGAVIRLDSSRTVAYRVEVTTIPAHREAYRRVTKDAVRSGRLGQVYQEIEDWIGAQGFEVAGASRETYWTDFHAASPDTEVFDVAWPIR